MSRRPLLHPLRSLLVKLHPYFSCCASCGEIKTPLDGRLCASLAPDFPVDGVLSGGTEQEAADLKRAMPWLRRAHMAQGEIPGALQNLPDLAGNFFVALADTDLSRVRHPLDLFTPNGIPLLAARPAALSPAEAAFCDVLETRGLMSARELSFASDIYALTRECLEGFGAFCIASSQPEFENASDRLAALARWAYASALAIPAGPAHPLLRHG